MSDAVPDFTPVHLITGFLGSGKTTLLQRLLRDPALANTAVLINEFGEVGLDHQLLERIDETMVLLQSGCLCCTIRGELSDAIRALHERREAGAIPAFQRLVIESTGLADPFPILSTLQADPVLKHHFRLGNVITTIDAVNAGGQFDRQPESVKQVAVADCLMLTKAEMAEADSVAALTARIRQINPAAPLWQTSDRIDAESLLAHGPFEATSKADAMRLWTGHGANGAHAHHQNRNRHGDDIRAFCMVFDQALDWTVFGVWLTMLLHCHGTAILRVKGILDVAGTSPPVAVHGVQHLVHPPTHMAAWPDATRNSRLVFIVKGLEPALIERSLRAFTGVPAAWAPAMA